MVEDNNANIDIEPIRRLQLVELNILKAFVKICEEEGLRFFMLGGTFLGAVRHKGFIPWDDDIDIGMPRPDYDRFFEIAQDRLPPGMIYKNYRKGNEENTYPSKIEDSAVQLEDSSAAEKKIRNAWIDIFPLDGMPNNKIIRNVKKAVLLCRRLLLKYSQFNAVVNQNLPGRPWYENLLIDIGKIIKPERFLNTKKCLEKIDKSLRRSDYETSEYVVNYMGAYKFKEMFPRNVYEQICTYTFETEELPAPKNYDLVLKQLYGEYMQIPEEGDRNKHRSRVLT